jgi:hypothetical protein
MAGRNEHWISAPSPPAVKPLGEGIYCNSTQGGRCDLPVVVSGLVGHYFCESCPVFCAKVAQNREMQFSMANNHGGMAWMSGGQGKYHVDVSGEGGTEGAMVPAPETFQILSLLQGRSFSDPAIYRVWRIC